MISTRFHAAGALGYGDDWTGKYFLNDVGFVFLNLTGSIGYQVNEQLSIGGALVIQQYYLDLSTSVAPLLPSGQDRTLQSDGDDLSPGYTLELRKVPIT